MYPIRWKIFIEIANTPALTQGEMARKLELTRAGILWHVKKMRDKGIIARTEKNQLYIPILLREEEAVYLSPLANPIRKAIFENIVTRGYQPTQIAERLNTSPQDISYHHALLKKQHILDEKSTPTVDIRSLKEHLLREKKDKKKRLLQLFKEENLNPKVLATAKYTIKIEVTIGGKRQKNTIPLIPPILKYIK